VTLPDPTAVPLAEIPAALGELERLKATLWARLTAPRPALAAVPAADRWLRAEEAGRLIGWSTSAIRKRGHALPGYRRLSPGRVRWSEQQLRQWLAAACREASA
jgi:predicted DNA-binding transcriptional regulator AlpA